MSVGAHDLHDRWVGTIQIDENVACVLVSGVGLNIDVAPLAVAGAQKADGSGSHQLGCCPKSFSRKRATCLVVNQTDQIQLVGHRREMPTNGLPSQKKSTVVHDRNCAIEATRRTMNPQRTASSVLTVCLTSGGRFTLHLLLSRLRKTQKALWYLKTEGEIRDFAIGHTPEVAARHYADIPALRHIHQKAVADGLQDALDAALKPYVLSPEEEDRLQRESGTADLSHPLSRITTALDGNHDLWLASCSDFFESPFGYSGQPCPQPFWGCFECHNAVITARKLPAILQFLDFITGQRATLSEAHWAAKFGRVWRRITAQILPAFPVAVVEDARRTQAVLQDALYLPPEVAVA